MHAFIEEKVQWNIASPNTLAYGTNQFISTINTKLIGFSIKMKSMMIFIKTKTNIRLQDKHKMNSIQDITRVTR